MNSEDDVYQVGYCKPPASGQFVKGRSGNPKGRPKGSKNLATIILRESRQRVRINGPRGTRTVTKLEATVMQTANKAAQGEPRASREFVHMVRDSEETVSTQGQDSAFEQADRETMQSILRRMKEISQEDAETRMTPEKDTQ